MYEAAGEELAGKDARIESLADQLVQTRQVCSQLLQDLDAFLKAYADSDRLVQR